MSLAIFALAAIAASVIAEEFLGMIHRACRFILRRGARRLPGDWAARYAEEWECDLLDLPGGPFTKVIWTIRTRLGAHALTTELIIGDRSHQQPEIVAPPSIAPKRAESVGMDEARKVLEIGSADLAVLLGFTAIQHSLHGLLDRAGISATGCQAGTALASTAADRGLASARTLHEIKELATIRNNVVHPWMVRDLQSGGYADASGIAPEFLTRAEAILVAIGRSSDPSAK